MGEELEVLICKRNNEAFSICFAYSLQVFCAKALSLVKDSPFAPCSPAIPATCALLLMISGVLCQGSAGASVSFGASFGLKSPLSSEPTKLVSAGTQAKLIILVRCLAEQVRGNESLTKC